MAENANEKPAKAKKSQHSRKRSKKPGVGFDGSPNTQNTASSSKASSNTHEARSRHSDGKKAPKAKRSSAKEPRPAPAPNAKYLAKASLQPIRLNYPSALLIVVDLNGTLILRNRNRSLTNFKPRPGLTSFLNYAFAHHEVMVWTSMHPETMAAILPKVFADSQQAALFATWARDKLDLSEKDYRKKVQVYKRLNKVWSNRGLNPHLPDGSLRWSQRNTILVDDSVIKASSQPFNLVHIPEFTEDNEIEANARILEKLVEYVKEASNWSDVSAYIKKNPFRQAGQTPEILIRGREQIDVERVVAPSSSPRLDNAVDQLTLRD